MPYLIPGEFSERKMKSEPAIWENRLLRPLKAAGLKGLDFILPPLCFGCSAHVETQGGLCAQCWSGLKFITDPMCTACGFPFPHEMPAGVLCAGCSKHLPNYQKARAALGYDDGSRRLVLAFKHGDKSQGLKTMGKWLHRAGEDLVTEADVIMPVPLHPIRLRRRKFNQAALLARALHMETGVPVDLFSLKRVKNTPTQGGLSRHKRAMNVVGAFRVPSAQKEAVRGKQILIIDDVLTTGATVDNCTRALNKAGAKGVYVLTLARVVQPLKKKNGK